MDLSNKSLAFILVVAIIISLGGTIISLNKLNKLVIPTGFATDTDTGEANLTINSTTQITFTVNKVDFGAGYTNDTNVGTTEYCNISTNGSLPASPCVGFFTTPPPAFLIQNDGNMNVTLELQSNASAAQFIGGTSPSLKWYFVNNETDSCSTGLNPTSWAEVNSSVKHPVCPNYKFGKADDADLIGFHVFVSIPDDAVRGEHKVTFTATGTEQ